MERRSKVLGVTVPPAPRVPVETAPLSRRESVFASLKPDRWAINVGFLLACGGLGTGGLFALNREAPAPQVDTVSRAAFDAEKALRVQTSDRLRALTARYRYFEAAVGAALYHGSCVPDQSKPRTKNAYVCGGLLIRDVAQSARVENTSIGDRVMFRVVVEPEIPQAVSDDP